MAQHHHHHPTSKKSISLTPTSFLFVSLLCFASLLLAFSLFKSSQNLHYQPLSHPSCDLSDGNWVYDPTVRSTRYDHTCKEIFKGWNCILNNKSNALEISKWKWKPRDCDLPTFDAQKFLERFRDTSIGTLFHFYCI